jgi:hypothetical protein
MYCIPAVYALTFRRSRVEQITWLPTKHTVCVLSRAALATSQAIYRPVNSSHVPVNQTWGAVSRNRRSNWKAGIQPDRSASSLELVAQNDLISLDLQH